MELKLQMKKEGDQKKRELINRRRKMIKHHIIRRKQQENKQKVIEIANEIMGKGTFNRGAYWEFMRKVKTKKRAITGRAINDKDGKRLDEPEKIKNRYAEFYKELLTTKKAETNDERKIEEVVDKCLEAIKKKAEHQGNS